MIQTQNLIDPRAPMRAPAAEPAPATALPMDVHDVQPLSEQGAHTFFKGVRPDGTTVFIKHNTVNALFKNPALSFLNRTLLHAQKFEFPNMDRLQDMMEVAFSHFAASWFAGSGQHYSGMTYDEVFFRDPKDGKPHLYIATPMVDHLETLNHVPAATISNPQQAVTQTLFRGLVMGDWNCTFRDSNVGIATDKTRMADGTPLVPGQIIDMDYGDAGGQAIARLGVPYSNRQLLEKYPQYVKPALEKICSLDKAQIHALMAEAGTHATGWTTAMTDHFANVMSANLDTLKHKLESDPDWLTRKTWNPMLSNVWPASAKQFVFRIPAGLTSMYTLKSSGLLATVQSADEAAEQVMRQKYPSQTFTTTAGPPPG